MTNSEVIKKLVYVRRYLDEYFDEDMINAVNITISTLEENDKLKAEIERLKGEREWCPNTRIEEFDKKTEIEQLKLELEQWQSTNLKLVCELTRIECENNQLKAELEQSVNEKAEVISKIEYALNECLFAIWK